MKFSKTTPLIIFILFIISGCASFQRCTSGSISALTSGDVVSTVFGVVFVPLIPVCTVVQAFGSLDSSEQQALVTSAQTLATLEQQRKASDGSYSNSSSPQGDSGQSRSQSGPSDGECKNGDPSCAIKGCNRSGGKAITYRNNLGCGVVSCRFSDSKYDWSSVYNYVPGSGCAGTTK